MRKAVQRIKRVTNYSLLIFVTSVLGLGLSGCSQMPDALRNQQNHVAFLGKWIQPETKEEAGVSSLTSAEYAAHKKALIEELNAYEAYKALDIPFGIDPPHFHQLSAQDLVILNENDNLWNDIRDNFSFDLTLDNKRINQQLSWYVRHPQYMDRVIERSRPYLHHIVAEIKKRGMPMEFALLPIVESAFDPFAYSHGRAAGIWQFIPGTGKLFGLKQNWWYDGRRDIVASTDAALTYLEKLSKQFKGDWLLALASYNSGAGTVRKAIRRNKKRGMPTDFWALKLPRETRAYVPKLIALAKIVQQPYAHALVLPPVKNQAYFTQVDTHGQIDLAQAARLANIDIDLLYSLNPGFNRWATDPDGPHRLAVPIYAARDFSQALSELPKEERMQWVRYKIKSGDSLIKIAKKFSTTPQQLKSINNIRGTRIRAGKTLLIPQPLASADSYTHTSTARLEKNQNRNRRGKVKINYTVKSGDSFWSIAKAYNVNVRQLAKTNNMAPTDTLRKNQKIVIWAPKRAPSTLSIAANHSSKDVVRKVNYRVRSGDSLSRIASRFNVSVAQITKWNTLNKKKYLQPGQKITLFVDVTNLP